MKTKIIISVFLFLTLFLIFLSFSTYSVLSAETEGNTGKNNTSCSSGLVPCGRKCDNPNTANDETKPCTLCHFIIGFWNLIHYAFRIMVYVGLAALVAAGIMYIVSTGNEKMIETAKTFIKNILTGFAIVLLAWVMIFSVMRYLLVKSDLGIKKADGWTKFECSTETETTSNIATNYCCVYELGKCGHFKDKESKSKCESNKGKFYEKACSEIKDCDLSTGITSKKCGPNDEGLCVDTVGLACPSLTKEIDSQGKCEKSQKCCQGTAFSQDVSSNSNNGGSGTTTLLSANPTSVSFTTTVGFASNTKAITFKNNSSNQDIKITKIDFNNNNTSSNTYFTSTSSSCNIGKTLSPGGSCALDVYFFSREAVKNFSRTLTVSYSLPDGSTQSINVNLSGSADSSSTDNNSTNNTPSSNNNFDLIIERFLAPSSINNYESSSVSVTIKNQGQDSVGSFGIKVFINETSSPSSRLAGSSSVNGLSAGQSTTLQISISPQSNLAVHHTYYFVVLVDADNTAVETDETNNTAFRPVIIGN